jgi:hypothetical protein
VGISVGFALEGGGSALAQMPQSWVQAREGQPSRLLQAQDGDLIVAASMVVPSSIGGAAFYDSVIERFTPDGSLRWRWQSGDTQIDRLEDAALDAQGNTYVVGVIGTSFWGQAPFAARLMKFSPAGQRLWSSTYTPGRAGFDTAPEGVRVSPDGSVWIYGQDYGVGTERDIFIARYDATGAHQWTFRRAGPVWDFVFDLTFDESGNAYWVGSTFRPGTSLNGACLTKLNPSGQQVWQWLQPLAGNSGGGLSRVSIDGEGNIVATGHSEHFPGYQDGMLLKATPGGTVVFYTLWDGPDTRWDRFFTHAILSDNSIAVSGDTYAGDGFEYYDVPTIRYSSDGRLLWTDIYGGTLYAPDETEEWSLNMFALPGDQVLTVSTDWSRPGYDYALHRYDRDGRLMERVVRELAVGDIKDVPPRCAVHDPARRALFLLGWGSGFPGNPVADHHALIRINLPDTSPACPADFNQDGGVDGADVEAFFLAWEAADARADTNRDGGVDGGDVEAFFLAWEPGGC